MVVHPEYRGKGVAKMLTEWGTNVADERGVEAVVISVPYARQVYEKCGFECVEVIDIDFSVPSPSQQWESWLKEDMRAFLMVRSPKTLDADGTSIRGL